MGFSIYIYNFILKKIKTNGSLKIQRSAPVFHERKNFKNKKEKREREKEKRKREKQNSFYLRSNLKENSRGLWRPTTKPTNQLPTTMNQVVK